MASVPQPAAAWAPVKMTAAARRRRIQDITVRYHVDEQRTKKLRTPWYTVEQGPMLSAIVLSAGFGTRLRPLTDNLPKPLMPVGDRPMIAHVTGALSGSGIERVVANTHHLAIDFEHEIERLGLDIEVVHEPEILGTAGGVANAGAALGAGEILIWNGDILAPALDVRSLRDRFEAAPVAALWVVEPTADRRGTVGLDEEGNVIRLRGEVFGREVSGGEYLGIQVMSAGLRETLPKEGCLVGDVALPLLRRGGKIASFCFRDQWDDVGEPAALLRANQRWLARRGLAAWSAADAELAPGVRLERSIVGSGARVRGAGVVTDSVVFPGAELLAPSERLLVAKMCRLAVAEP
jgi:mannose-1-phosphate guanylyltransferase